MKQILTKKQKNKNTKRNQLILGMILILLMIFSTLGYALNSSEEEKVEKIEYNGVEFVKNYDVWVFNFQENQFLTKYNPEETKEIDIISKLSLEDYKGKPLYLSGESQEPFIEISKNIGKFALRIQKACLPDEGCEGLPVKDCSEDNMIIIREPLDNKTEINYQQDNCFFIIADSENQTKYADAFLFDIIGI